MIELYIIGCILGAVLLAGVVIFNQLIAAKNHCQEAWSGIDVQLKLRHNLVPNLVATVQAYAQHESNILERTAQARQRAKDSVNDKITARSQNELQLSTQLGQIFVVAEAYPELKADALFLELQQKLVEVEDNIQMARRFYNGCVRNLNIAIQSFPSNIVANLFKFKEAVFFEFTDSRESIAISFDD